MADESEAVMYDLLNEPISIGDDIVFCNNGRLYYGELMSVSGPTCSSCVVSVWENNRRRFWTLQLRNARRPRRVKKGESIQNLRLFKVK